jgi:acetyl-CoA/propionyl-CoA carboxylase, biotin carboxylase, biotin carboxyl carrier protein
VLQKILIANRGEIAVRVMRTCRELGIPTVAVYSELDRDALHVRYADEAYALGGQTAAESYLNTDAILGVIERSGADGVHPGYGFYAENAEFARVIGERGVTWIGPPPEAIDVMGDKISARRAADRGGVESVPGTLDPIESADDVIAFGERVGWPVAIKAAYGGGGRGMKVVDDAEHAQSALDSAQREALAYFGRDEAYLEKYLPRPRHIEMQIFADTHGNAVWLGERDCSVQRRHQKLVEESPAANLSQKTRTAMGEAAVKVAKACGYVNAGTVEMLYQPVEGSEDGEFYFLEMNTRLQVEHCVTEMVTSLDLVAEQIRVAKGEQLSFTQDEVAHNGHSIEVRINAENAAKGFLPSPGPINKLRIPSGPGVRWDGGYEEGDSISQYYDNLLAKLVVWAPDRERARLRMLRALQELVVEGIHTTVPAHELVLNHPDFAAGHHSTNWLETEVDLSGLTSSASPDGAITTDAADGAEPETLTERTVPVEVDGKRFNVKLWLPDAPVVSGSGGGAASGKRAPKPRAAASSGSGGDGTINAPMQGTIVKVLVNVGDTVEAGQAVLVLEAMKMENHIASERGGTVTEVRVSAGETVGTGAVLVIIE